jgi:hypothetical protein
MSFIWLNNLKLVEGRKSGVSLKIFPVLPLELCCMEQPHHWPLLVTPLVESVSNMSLFSYKLLNIKIL